MTFKIRVEEIFAALRALDAPDELKVMFLRGAAAGFAASWRGEESKHCLTMAEGFAERSGGEKQGRDWSPIGGAG